MTIVFDITGMDELTGGRLATLDPNDSFVVIRVPRQAVRIDLAETPVPATATIVAAFDEGEPTWEDAEWQ